MRVQAIFNLYPDAAVVDDSVGVLHRNGNPIIIDESAVQTEVSRLQAEYDAQAYVHKRVQEYPPIGDQLDALFKAGVFPADMAAAIQAVKDKYPKGTA